MDRRDTAQRFRERLLEAMTNAGVNRSTLAAASASIAPRSRNCFPAETDRLPRAEYSSGDCLCPEREPRLAARPQPAGEARRRHSGGSVEVKESARAPVDESLTAWYAEAVGYKIRHVPATLPDLMKTEEVLDYEYRDFAARSADRAIAISHGRLAMCGCRRRTSRSASRASPWKPSHAPRASGATSRSRPGVSSSTT